MHSPYARDLVLGPSRVSYGYPCVFWLESYHRHDNKCLTKTNAPSRLCNHLFDTYSMPF